MHPENGSVHVDPIGEFRSISWLWHDKFVYQVRLEVIYIYRGCITRISGVAPRSELDDIPVADDVGSRSFSSLHHLISVHVVCSGSSRTFP